jgi:hypothetical protein
MQGQVGTVEAVICEPVSAVGSLFYGKIRGKFVDFEAELAKAHRLPDGNSIV